jgi:hypothetical protein
LATPASSPKSGINDGAAALIPTPALVILKERKEEGDKHISLADLVGEPLVNGKICCPFHDDSTPSLHIYHDHFHCYGCGAHGDAIDWLMMVEGFDRDAALQELKGGRTSTIGPAARSSGSESPAEAEANRRRALRLWRQAQPIAGTLAECYLAERRWIDLDALPDYGEASLRFHPHCPFGQGSRHPCLLALRRDIASDKLLSIHRIALTPDGNKIERRMLGRGGVVKLWPAGPQLVIGEGIETTLAAATRISRWGAPLQPAWSAVASGVLGNLPVIPGVERLIILVDHDLNGAGQMAAMRCTERWTRAGHSVVRLMPKRPGSDFNDLVMELAS